MRKILLLLSLVCALSAFAKKDKYTRVYMFGVATAFNDSTVVFTDIQAVDSAFVTKKKLLPERSLYSYQLENYYEDVLGRRGMTVAVFWGTDRKKVEKDYLRVRNRFINDPTSKVVGLSSEEFCFRREEHITDDAE